MLSNSNNSKFILGSSSPRRLELLRQINLFPDQMKQIKAGQMNMDEAIELSSDLPAFVSRVEQSFDDRIPLNGIVGDIENYEYLDAQEMMQRMWNVASEDLRELIEPSS